jgi:toxin CcdB
MPRSQQGYVVTVQSRLLDELAIRVVIPLPSRQDSPTVPIKELNPILSVDGAQYGLMTQNMAAIPVRQLGTQVNSLAAERDHIVRAIDALISGL